MQACSLQSNIWENWHERAAFQSVGRLFFCLFFVKLQILGLRLGVDFTFTLDNNDNNDNNNRHLNFFKGTVLGVKEQGLGIRDKG